jgi:hypothetical protein
LARVDRARLRDAVPPRLTWAARVFSLLPTAITVLAQATPDRLGLRGSSHDLWLRAFAAAGALLLAAAVERVQLGVLRGRRLAATIQESAFDEAFRAQTALILIALPVGFAYLVAAITVSGFPHRPGAVGTAVFLAWTALSICGMGVSFAIRSQWAQRYYRRGYPDAPPAFPTGVAAAC